MSVIPLSLSGKEFRVANKVRSWTDNRPYKLGLTSKYNEYNLERARMGRCADKNGMDKAFSQLEITNYWDSIHHEAWLTSQR